MHHVSFYLVYFGQPEGHQKFVFSGSAYLYVARIKFKIFIKSPFGNITGRGIAAQILDILLLSLQKSHLPSRLLCLK